MDSKKFKVRFIKDYVVEVDPKASEEYIKKLAESRFNNEIEFHLLSPIHNNFKIEIINNE